MKTIKLTSKEELAIYMSPTRQQLLRQLSLTNTPLTPKMLSDRLNISASGVQHHIKKLIQLGLVELDHKEIINGITARFYKPAQVTVQIGLGWDDDLKREREVLMQGMVAEVYDGFREHMKRRLKTNGLSDSVQLAQWGDIRTGIVYLDAEESVKLMKLLNQFIESHSSPTAEGRPWEYALIAYDAGEIDYE